MAPHWVAFNGIDLREVMKHKRRFSILINGRYHDLLKDAEIPLNDGDVVAIMPLVAGG